MRGGRVWRSWPRAAFLSCRSRRGAAWCLRGQIESRASIRAGPPRETLPQIHAPEFSALGSRLLTAGAFWGGRIVAAAAVKRAFADVPAERRRTAQDAPTSDPRRLPLRLLFLAGSALNAALGDCASARLQSSWVTGSLGVDDFELGVRYITMAPERSYERWAFWAKLMLHTDTVQRWISFMATTTLNNYSA